MKMQELMERVGDDRFHYIKALVKDALGEIQLVTNDNVDSFTTDIINDQDAYGTPTNMIKLKSISILDTHLKLI